VGKDSTANHPYRSLKKIRGVRPRCPCPLDDGGSLGACAEGVGAPFRQTIRKVEHDCAFARLIAGGHGGCALVGQIKKGRYIYDHCTRFTGKCPKPHIREEVLEERFADLLKGLVLDDEVMAWMPAALRQSHEDERRHHQEAIARLQAEYTRLQNHLEGMYGDKLAGRVETIFVDQQAGEWRPE
jgi:site-specific DNA recombinase